MTEPSKTPRTEALAKEIGEFSGNPSRMASLARELETSISEEISRAEEAERRIGQLGRAWEIYKQHKASGARGDWAWTSLTQELDEMADPRLYREDRDAWEQQNRRLTAYADLFAKAMESDPAGAGVPELLAAAVTVLRGYGGGPLADRLEAVGLAFGEIPAAAPEPPASEPRGCPTPGACSCPGYGNAICRHVWAPAELSESGDRVMGRCCSKCGIPQDIEREQTSQGRQP